MTSGRSAPAHVAVVGGGIVGLATALALSERHPRARLLVVEKESRWAAHQTGHNSGVVHSGLYYRPGSLKARLCAEGARLLEGFCQEHGVPWARSGKLVVATEEQEFPRLAALHDRGLANGVEGLRLVGPEEVRELEPEARALRALHCPATGVVDFAAAARAMAAVLEARGVELCLGSRLLAAGRDSPGTWRLETTSGDLETRGVVACAGLHADRVARLLGVRPQVRILPFRGEYYLLRPEAARRVRALVYPVPDPRFPFLGVHLTRTVGGEVEAGPNAVLALAREGYRHRDVRPMDVAGYLGYLGFWAMAARHWRTGAWEVYRSLSRRAFLRSLRRLVPALAQEDLLPGGSGVRAQAVAPDGTLVDDFRIQEVPGALLVLNAPSPAATASLAIGRHLAERIARILELP
ncbi:MAG: L-2-hydroxyglutarate oxidase [Planctomycetes bacterium]|nr:L-2-hydroxyglutarate oxidase [Planctomycetota bacterium]